MATYLASAVIRRRIAVGTGATAAVAVWSPPLMVLAVTALLLLPLAVFEVLSVRCRDAALRRAAGEASGASRDRAAIG
jgi:hypothetical protein